MDPKKQETSQIKSNKSDWSYFEEPLNDDAYEPKCEKHKQYRSWINYIINDYSIYTKI